MLRRVAALGLFATVLAGALVPCSEPPMQIATGVATAASETGADCHGSELPELLASCPCGCAARPQVAGVPVAVDLAIRAARPGLLPPIASLGAPALPALRARAGVVPAPEPVPLVLPS
jgi:hypothetical protein